MAAMKGDFRKQQATPYHMNPNVPYIKNPKPVANDLLRELLTAPGGLDKMNQQQQYGKLVEMRQRQAMVDRSDGAMREHQRLTQDMTEAQRLALQTPGNVAGVPAAVQAAVRNAMARQKRDLEDASMQVQSRPVRMSMHGPVVGASNVGARLLQPDAVVNNADANRMRNEFQRGIATGVGQEQRRQAGKGRGRGRG